VVGAFALSSAVAGGAQQNDYVRAVSPVSKSSASNSDNKKSVQASCPKGTRALSGGASIGGNPRGVGLEQIGPVGTSGWSATASEVRSTSAKWSLTVSITCADVAGDPSQSVTTDAGPKGPPGIQGPPGADVLAP
jgi:hypothetical protein